jgi:hypothetical protein
MRIGTHGKGTETPVGVAQLLVPARLSRSRLSEPGTSVDLTRGSHRCAGVPGRSARGRPVADPRPGYVPGPRGSRRPMARPGPSMSASVSKVPRVPDGTAAAALVRPAVVGDDDVAGVVQGTCRADRGAFVGTMPPVEHGADHVRLATVEGGGAGVFGIARVPADAESKTPAAEGEGGPAGAGTETSGPLGGIDVLLVVADGLSAVAAQDQGGDVQPRGGRVAGGGSDHRGGPGRRRRRRWPGCPVRCRGLDRPPRSAGHPARPEDHP